MGSEESTSAPVLSGIPQGSILGPILFTVFINDMPECVKSSCKIFADDTKIFNRTVEKDIIQEDIYSLQNWSDRWNLYFNVAKCHVMHVGVKNEKCDYTMKLENELKTIESCEEEKDLGITFDSKLSFDQYIKKIVSKANQMIGIIKRAFTYLDKETFLKLYKAFIRPHLEYGNVIWAPHLLRQSRYVENVQRRATRLLPECKDMNYTERLEYLKLHSLKGRRIRGDMIQMFKIVNGIDNLNLSSLFTSNPCTLTRNSEGKFLQQHCSTNIRLNTFSFRVLKHWNSLPQQWKYAKNTNTFKNLLDASPKFIKLFNGFD